MPKILAIVADSFITRGPLRLAPPPAGSQAATRVPNREGRRSHAAHGPQAASALSTVVAGSSRPNAWTGFVGHHLGFEVDGGIDRHPHAGCRQEALPQIV